MILTAHLVVLFITPVILSATTTKAPKPTPVYVYKDLSPAEPRRKVNPQLADSCDTAEKRDVASKAWENAAYLAEAHSLWKPGDQYQHAMDLYLGMGSREDDRVPPLLGPLQQNIQRQKALFFEDIEWSPSRATHVTIHCGDDSVSRTGSDCLSEPRPNMMPIAWTQGSSVRDTDYREIILCDGFFDDDFTAPLSTLIEQARVNRQMQEFLDIWVRWPREAIIFHETYHWAGIADPACFTEAADEVYDIPELIELTRRNDAETTIRNRLSSLSRIFQDKQLTRV